MEPCTGSLRILVFIFLFQLCACVIQERQARNVTSQAKHSTKIACEGDILNITCPANHVIQIIRANYGRFSLLECNDKSETWEDNECSYPGSARVMEERCQFKQSCHVPADDETFGDQCPDTFKYLETTYECLNEEFRTTYPSMPPTTTQSDTTETPLQLSEYLILSAATDLVTPWSYSKASTSTGKEEGKIQPSFCPETVKRGIQWPSTRVNFSAKVTCPNSDDEHHYAEWHCSSDGTWFSTYPDMSRCVSPWVHQLKNEAEKVKSLEEAKSILHQLQERTSKPTQFYGGDAKISIQVMESLSHRLSAMIQDDIGEDPTSKQITGRDITLILANITDNLLQNDASWLELPPTDRSTAADRLLSAMETCMTMPSMAGMEFDSPRIAMQINTPISSTHQEFTKLPSKPFQSSSNYDNAQIPTSIFTSSSSHANSTKISIISYDHSLGDYLTHNSSLPIHDKSNKSSPDQPIDRRIVSRLMTVSVTQLDPTTQRNRQVKFQDLKNPILLTFAIKKSEGNLSKAVCVYWETSSKRWSSDGCSSKEENQTHVVCACNHLTTFAVLMDVYGLVLSPRDHLVLLFITYFGCIISMVACAFAILAFCFFRASSHADRITIHINLCLCLLLAEATFVFGIDNADYPIMCSVVAALLHYLFLAAFAWMLLEGVQLYALLIEVFEPENSRKRYFYLFGYGAPIIIVGVSFLIDPKSYGTPNHCWLSTENYFVYSFIGPVAVVLMANVTFLLMALGVMCRHINFSSSYQHDRDRRSFFDNIRMWLKGALVLVILLGLTWTLGFVYIVHATPVMAYAFTIVNSLQGLFIFIFHVLLNQQIRKDIRSKFQHQVSVRAYWMRTPTSTSDSKATKTSNDEPTPMLGNGVKSDEASKCQQLNMFERLCSRTGDRNSKNGSVGPLVSSKSSGSNSNGVKEHDYDYFDGSCASPDDTGVLSEPLTDLSSYTINSHRCPPNCPPPSPPSKPVPAQRRARTMANPSMHDDQASTYPLVDESNHKESKNGDLTYEVPIHL